MAKLGEVCIQITDGSHNPPSGVEQSEYLMLSSKNIDDDFITLDSPRFLSHSDYIAENKRTTVSEGDLLMTIVGTIGRVAIVPEELKGICLQRSVAVIKPEREVVNNRYLMYQLQNMRPFLEKEARGVAQKGIYLKQVSQLDIKLPELEHQMQIVKVLDKASKLIFLRRQQLAKLDELIKARFVEMFGDPVNNPMNYPKSQLGKVCDVRDGTHDSPEYYDVGYPLVTSKNVTGGKIDLSECNLISEDDYKKICERSKVDRGDIIMPMIGTVGKPVIVNTEPMFAIKNVALIKFTPDSLVTNIYIKTLLESDYFDRAVLDKIRGGTQKFIALGDIRKLEIILPDLKHQQCFSTFVERVNQQKQTVQQSLEKLELMKKALMQEYFG